MNLYIQEVQKIPSRIYWNEFILDKVWENCQRQREWENLERSKRGNSPSKAPTGDYQPASCQNSHRPEGRGMTHPKSWKQETVNQEFYTQKNYPLKMKVKLRKLKSNTMGQYVASRGILQEIVKLVVVVGSFRHEEWCTLTHKTAKWHWWSTYINM